MSSTAPEWRSIYLEMIQLERAAALHAPTIRPPILGGHDPTLRDLLLRAGAAWLIGWAGLLSILNWGVPG